MKLGGSWGIIMYHVTAGVVKLGTESGLAARKGVEGRSVSEVLPLAFGAKARIVRKFPCGDVVTQVAVGGRMAPRRIEAKTMGLFTSQSFWTWTMRFATTLTIMI